jgi:hypothetical protein
VDVFFSKDFYGKYLIPAVLVNTDEAYNLMHRIFQLKGKITSLSDISNDPLYDALMEKFAGFEDIISNEVQNMV